MLHGMRHGVRFIDEHPQIKEVLERLYLKRELDQWYIERSRKKFEVPSEIYDIKHVAEVKVQEGHSPSAHVYVKLKDVHGEGGFVLQQEMQLTISKIVPVYKYNILNCIKHNSIVGFLGLFGGADTFELMEVEEQIQNILEQQGYIRLYEEYDLYDTVYEWNQLQGIDPVNRRLILEDAVFVDVLDLLD